MNDRKLARRQPARLISLIALLASPAVAAQSTVSYQYDALGRLKSIQRGGSKASISNYEFDAAGNRRHIVTNAAETVLNGPFESPALSNYNYRPSVANIVFSGNSGIAVNGDDWHFPLPWDGRQVAFVQSSPAGEGGSVELTAINLVVGRTYQFTFAVAQRPGFPANSLKAYIDNNLVFDRLPPSAAQFSAFPTPPFVASSSTSKIRFSSSPSDYDSASGIDSVGIERLN